MSTTYKAQAGDSFDTISRKFYGVESFAYLIKAANPQINNTIKDGDFLIVPNNITTPNIRPQTLGNGKDDDVVVIIKGVRFTLWNSLNFTRSFDTISTLELNIPFNAKDPELFEILKPFSYSSVEMLIGSELVFTGTLISSVPNVGEKNKTVQLSCYSVPGVLHDCNPPISSYPLQFNEQPLYTIASRLIAPFGLILENNAPSATVPFKQVNIKSTDKIMDFIIDLGKQRNVYFSSNSIGQLVMQEAKLIGNPVARLEEGKSPLNSISATFSTQNYYSTITGVAPVVKGAAGSVYTVKNASLIGVMRPLTFKASDVGPGDLIQAVEGKLSRMNANAVSYTLKIIGWRDHFNLLFEPNTFIMIESPSAFIPNEFKFLIRSVVFNMSDKEYTTTLNIVLIGAFNGGASVFPWDV